MKESDAALKPIVKMKESDAALKPIVKMKESDAALKQKEKSVDDEEAKAAEVKTAKVMPLVDAVAQRAADIKEVKKRIAKKNAGRN